jgi:hypothetical protein
LIRLPSILTSSTAVDGAISNRSAMARPSAFRLLSLPNEPSAPSVLRPKFDHRKIIAIGDEREITG